MPNLFLLIIRGLAYLQNAKTAIYYIKNNNNKINKRL